MPDTKEVVVIEVENFTQGNYVLDELEVQEEHGVFSLEDAALAYRDDRGKVKIKQSRDMTAGQGAGWGAGVGLIASVFIGGPIAAALVGAGVGAMSSGIGDKGIDNEMMKKHEEALNNGRALVFVQVDSSNAGRLADFVEGKAWQFIRQGIREGAHEEIAAAAAST